MRDEEVARRGETLACEMLEAGGWEIAARNWSREIGELDLVAVREQAWGDQEVTQVAFVEVKTREFARGPLPEQRVDAAKRRKIVTLGKLYLAEHRMKRALARFDVIGVDLETQVVRHYPAAFDGTGQLR